MKGYKKELTEEEKEKIINDFLPFIKYNAHRLAWRLPQQLTVEDLISVGIIGLLDALRRYKKNKAKISTFVEYRIKGAMLDEIRSHYWLPKSIKKKMVSIENAYLELEREKGRMPEPEEIADRLNIRLDEYYKILQKSFAGITLRFEDLKKIGAGDSSTTEENIIDPDMKTPLEMYEDNVQKEFVADLIDKLPEREKLILSLYYWDELTMKEIGKILNITEGRVCQLHNQALMRLKSALKLSPTA